MRELQVNAADEIRVFMVSSSDHITPVTGATVAVTLLKKGQTAFAAGAGTVTEAGGGWYIYYATAGDTTTLGPLAVRAVAAGCDAFNTEYQVKYANPYVKSTVKADEFGTDLNLTTNMANEVASRCGLALYSYGAATASALATVDNIVDAILVDTSTTLPAQLTSIQSHGDSNWATATGFSTHSASDVWAVTTRALTDKANFALSTAGISAVQSGMATASALSAVDTVVDAIKVSTDKFETMIILDGAVYQYTTNSLENAPSGSGATPAEIDAYLTDRHGSGSWQTGGTGSGANAETITITDGTSPLDGVNVWATTDSAGVNVVASGYTNALGTVTFLLDSGTYYIWQQLAGYNFTNPQTLVVS